MPVDPPSLGPALAYVADGDEWLARSLEAILEPHGISVVPAESGRALLERVRATPPDLVIIPDHLPDVDGLTLCRRLRGEKRLGRATPIIMLTEPPVRRARRLAALRAGAWKVAVAPLDAEVFVATLTNFVAVKRELDLVREQSLMEAGTEVYNAQGLIRRASELVAGAQRHGRSLGCMVVSMDCGLDGTDHPGPPQAQQLAGLLRSSVRAPDAVGRLSDTEFVVIAPETGRDGAVRLARRLAALGEKVMSDARGRPVQLRIGGCAIEDLSTEAVPAGDLLTRATLALRETRCDSEAQRIRFFEGHDDADGNENGAPGEASTHPLREH